MDRYTKQTLLEMAYNIAQMNLEAKRMKVMEEWSLLRDVVARNPIRQGQQLPKMTALPELQVSDVLCIANDLEAYYDNVVFDEGEAVAYSIPDVVTDAPPVYVSAMTSEDWETLYGNNSNESTEEQAVWTTNNTGS